MLTQSVTICQCDGGVVAVRDDGCCLPEQGPRHYSVTNDNTIRRRRRAALGVVCRGYAATELQTTVGITHSRLTLPTADPLRRQ